MKRWRIVFFVYILTLTVGLVHPKGGEITGFAGASAGEHPDLQHFLAFVVLAALAIKARFEVTRTSLGAKLLVYAVAGEVVQMVIPGRTACLMDGLANVLGIATGLGLWVITTSVGKTNGGQQGK